MFTECLSDSDFISVLTDSSVCTTNAIVVLLLLLLLMMMFSFSFSLFIPFKVKYIVIIK